jgi:hypothetical protein
MSSELASGRGGADHEPVPTGTPPRALFRSLPAWLTAWFMGLPFRRAIWLAPLVWALHESEEWNINEFESKHFADPGHFALVDHPVLWIGLAQVALNGAIWTGLTGWPKNPKFAAFLSLPFFVFFSFANVLQHIYMTVYFGGYTPGVLTAVLLVGPVVVGLTIKAIRDRLIPWWYAALLYASTIPTLISIVHGMHQTPPELPPLLVYLQRNGIHVARQLLGRHP